MSDMDKDAYIEQLQARVKELDASMQKLADSAFNVITYWRKKYYESTK